MPRVESKSKSKCDGLESESSRLRVRDRVLRLESELESPSLVLSFECFEYAQMFFGGLESLQSGKRVMLMLRDLYWFRSKAH